MANGAVDMTRFAQSSSESWLCKDERSDKQLRQSWSHDISLSINNNHLKHLHETST